MKTQKEQTTRMGQHSVGKLGAEAQGSNDFAKRRALSWRREVHSALLSGRTKQFLVRRFEPGSSCLFLIGDWISLVRGNPPIKCAWPFFTHPSSPPLFHDHHADIGASDLENLLEVVFMIQHAGPLSKALDGIFWNADSMSTTPDNRAVVAELNSKLGPTVVSALAGATDRHASKK